MDQLKRMGWLTNDVSYFYCISGLTDDDLRETAYEILLACAGATGYASIISLGLWMLF